MQIPGWLRPPQFEDEEKQRVGQILYWLLLTFLVADIFVIFVYAFTTYYSVLAALLGALLLIAISFLLLQQKRLTGASLMILLALLGLVNYLLIIGQGIHDTGTILYPIIIIVAAMLLSNQLFFLITALAIVSILVITLAEINGLIHTDFGSFTSVVDVFAVATILLVTATAIRLLANNLTQSLTRARRNEQALAQSNERLQAQADALSKSEARWRSLVEYAPDVIMNVLRDGRLVYVNTPPGDWQQGTIFDIVPHYQRSLVQRALHDVFETGRSTHFETQAYIAPGELGWFSVRLSPILTSEQVTSITLIATNITERKAAEAALRESEIRYGSLFEDSPISLWEDDFSAVKTYLDAIQPQPDDWSTYLAKHPRQALRAIRRVRVLDVNQATLTLFKAPNKNTLFDRYQTLFGREGMHLLTNILANLAQGKKSFAGEAQLFDLAGERMYCAFQLALAPGYEDTWEKVFVSVLDLTARRQVEAERERLISELEAKNAELERFTYTVSHDLKSPLITIKGFLGFVEQDAANGAIDQLQTDLKHIRDAANTMQELLDDLLELSRIGRLVNPAQTVRFDELVREALERVAGQISLSGADIRVMSDMPLVYGDRPRLVEVLQNLIDNALKFMGDQTQPLVEIGSVGHTPPTFFVRDNGQGIDPRYHEKVFGLFDRLNPDIDGTGIGLALVKRIIEVHEGQIWVESDGDGHGTTFFFTLPAPPTTQEI